MDGRMSAICHTDHVINSVPILSEHFSLILKESSMWGIMMLMMVTGDCYDNSGVWCVVRVQAQLNDQGVK